MQEQPTNFEPFSQGVAAPKNPLSPVTLPELPEHLRRACRNAGWEKLTEVQSLASPYILAGRDMMIQSRTGSGKTGCYLLPMLEFIDASVKVPQALVLVPTRELAVQVEREAATLFFDSGLASCAVYGGTGYKKQMESLAEGPQVIIGTPGRVLDHLLRRTLDLNALRLLVFDEADRMLSIGFYPDMVAIASHLPKSRQTVMFSATYPQHVLNLAAQFMRHGEMLSLSRDAVHVAEVAHLYCQVNPMDRDRALVRLLEIENPSAAIIFCNTKSDVHYIAGVLKGFGYRAEELSADLPQKKRENVLERLRKGGTRYLVATDLAARGLDIPDLSHVFLYQPPEDREIYIHRAGRTGRAGASGTVISLVDVIQKLELERLGRIFNINLREIAVPDDEEVAKVACMRLGNILESRLRNLTGLERLRAERYLPLARELTAGEGGDDQESLAILAMLLDDCHRQSLDENREPVTCDLQERQRRPGRRRSSSRRGQGQKRE